MMTLAYPALTSNRDMPMNWATFLRITALLTGVCDGLLAVLLTFIGLRLLTTGKSGLGLATAGDQFAGGMFVAGLGIGILAAAAVLGSLAAACCIVYRRAARHGSIGRAGAFFVILSIGTPAILLAVLVWTH